MILVDKGQRNCRFVQKRKGKCGMQKIEMVKFGSRSADSGTSVIRWEYGNMRKERFKKEGQSSDNSMLSKAR